MSMYKFTRLALWGVLVAAFGRSAHTARFIADGSAKLQAPKWPDTYEVGYTVTLPYAKTIQPEGIKYPVYVWYDGPNQKYRYDAYDGLNSVGYDMQKGVDWNVHPRILEMDCYTGNATGGGGPIRRRLGQLLAGSSLGPSLEDDTFPVAPIPDISRWSYAGTAKFGNAEEAVVWQFSRRHGEKTFEYQFYTSHDGLPLRLHMMGENLITGGHFDEYIIEFTSYKPGPIDPAIFELSKLCVDKMRERQQQQQPYVYDTTSDMRRAAAQVGMLLPSVRVGPAAASPWGEMRVGRSETQLDENARFVEEHNTRYRAALAAAAAAGGGVTTAATSPGSDDAPTYGVALNHFSYMSYEQFKAAMLGRRKPVATGSSAAAWLTHADRVYKRVLLDEQLPPSVDWRGTGADGPGVKDQACCGSCWTFSATGAMQGAWYTKTGQSRSFSEQQLLDCSWDYGNNGCDGGEVKPALQYLIDSGGVAAIEDEYPYMGTSQFCKGPFAPPRNHTSTFSKPKPAESFRFTGYINVPSRDEKALMEVLALHGPVSIGIDGSRRGFRFYSEGVFHDPHCHTVSADLDHAVVLVGYGTTPEGIDYWLIKNIWSKYWGMDGYMRITRKGNDCGVSSDAVMAIVEKVETVTDAATA